MPMIPILNYPDIDGARYSRTSIELSAVATQTLGNATSQIAPALRIEGWTYWNYKRTLDAPIGYGHRATPQTRTRGKLALSSELGLYMEDYILLERYLTLIGNARGRGAFEQAFQLTATLFELGLGTTRWDAIGCRIKEDGSGPAKESDDELEVVLQLQPMNIFCDRVAIVRENTVFGQAGVIVTF